MSFNSALQPVSTLCSQTTGNLANGLGTVNLGTATAPFYPSTSKIVGVSGIAGNTYSVTINTITQVLAAAKSAQVTVASSSSAENTPVVIYWVNTQYPGLTQC